VAEDIKKVERRVASNDKKIEKQSPNCHQKTDTPMIQIVNNEYAVGLMSFKKTWKSDGLEVVDIEFFTQ
jgi:hypothetical protein